MNLSDAKIALAAVGVADYRLRNLPPSDAEALAHMWVRHLPDVPLGWVLGHVERHYREPDPVELTSGRVLWAYREWQAAEQAAEDAVAERQESAGMLGLGDLMQRRPSWFDTYRARCDEAADWAEAYAHTGGELQRHLAHARQAVTAVPVPEAARPVDPGSTREQRIRRCTFHQLCACAHTGCRDGWLDAEEALDSISGLMYPAVKRCPFCDDALKMAVERGIAKAPSTRAAGQRRRVG
jgi:hypothetical protein